MKTLKDFYFENPQAYADIVAQANREHKKIEVVNDKMVLVDKEPNVLGYKVLRAKEYPRLQDQLDMLWHAIDEGKLDKTSDFYLRLKAVKEMFPKDA